MIERLFERANNAIQTRKDLKSIGQIYFQIQLPIEGQKKSFPNKFINFSNFQSF